MHHRGKGFSSSTRRVFSPGTDTLHSHHFMPLEEQAPDEDSDGTITRHKSYPVADFSGLGAQDLVSYDSNRR